MDYTILLLVTFCIISKLACADLCELSALFANCSKRGLSEVPQNLPDYITKLELSDNNITKIEPKAFKRYGKLVVLHLAHNKISILDSDAFIGLCELKVLSLTGNRLDHTKYPNNVFRPLKNIQELYLNRNLRRTPPSKQEQTCKYSDKAFSWMVNLNILSIDLCGSSDFGIGFLKLIHLQNLTFDYCLAYNLTRKTFSNFRNSNVTVLNLSRCELYEMSESIDAGILDPFSNVTSLDLSNSYFSLKHALKLLLPFRNKKMDMINFHHDRMAKR